MVVMFHSLSFWFHLMKVSQSHILLYCLFLSSVLLISTNFPSVFWCYSIDETLLRNDHLSLGCYRDFPSLVPHDHCHVLLGKGKCCSCRQSGGMKFSQGPVPPNNATWPSTSGNCIWLYGHYCLFNLVPQPMFACNFHIQFHTPHTLAFVKHVQFNREETMLPKHLWF